MPQTFESLYLSWHKQMQYVAVLILQDPYLAEDAVQNALLRIFRQLRYLPEDEKALRAYVLTSAKHAALDLLPKKSNEVDIDSVVLSDERDLFAQIAASEDYERLLAAISDLPEVYREVLMLRYVQDWKLSRIANFLGKSRATVSKQLQRAKVLLERNYFKEENQ